MATQTRNYPNKGIVNFEDFTRIAQGHWEYFSRYQHRTYTLRSIQREDGKYYWNCDCAGARKISHPQGKQCKHEIALTYLLKARYEEKCLAEIQAEEAAANAERQQGQSELTRLRAERRQERREIAVLRAELAEMRQALAAIQSQPAPDLSAILAELANLRAENVAIKKALATKATARRKHQTETEAAQIKEQINTALDDATEQAEAAINAVKMARAQIADLESIPHSLKEQLDRLTEEGKEELRPEYEAPEPAPEIKAAVREAQEADRKRRSQAEKERREKAPLNGNQGFPLIKK